MDKTTFTVIVAMNRNESSAGYGVMTSRAFNSWVEGRTEKSIQNTFGLLWGGSEMCATFETWSEALKAVTDAGSEIDNVVPCMAF